MCVSVFVMDAVMRQVYVCVYHGGWYKASMCVYVYHGGWYKASMCVTVYHGGWYKASMCVCVYVFIMEVDIKQVYDCLSWRLI